MSRGASHASLFLAVVAAVSHGRPDPPSPAQVQISPAPGTAPRAGLPVVLTGAEFELLTLTGYSGPVTWDVTAPDGGVPPVVVFECSPKESVIGVRAGTKGPARHVTPEAPTVAVFPAGTGRAVVSAWGVEGGKPKKLAGLAVDANIGPRPPPDPVVPKPDPVVPKPDPVVPKPDPVPAADPELVKSLKTALGTDVAARGEKEKAFAKTLGEVYLASAAKLKEEANPITFGRLYSNTFEASVLAGVPRRDAALTEVRKVIDGLGKHDPDLVLTGVDKDRYLALWNKIGASLVEASK